MQTFVPYPDFHQSAKVLNYRRLGKQRVETLQILNSLTGLGKAGWKNHPATKMWAGHESGLIAYGIAMCDAWIALGYKDTCREKISALGCADETDLPSWWGDDRVHSSHRSNLLRKFPEFYSQFGWLDDPSAAYVWPIVAS